MSRLHNSNLAQHYVHRRWQIFLSASLTFLTSSGLLFSIPTKSSPTFKNAGEELRTAANPQLPTPAKLETPSRRMSSGDKDEDALECRLPVVITSRDPDGVFARSEPFSDVSQMQDSLLVSIDGKSMRGKTLPEIQELCIGAEGDAHVLGVLNREGDFHVFKFTCRWLRSQQTSRQTLNQLETMLYRFDCTNGSRWEEEAGQPEGTFDASNLDLFTAGLERENLLLAEDAPESSAALVKSAAIGSVGWLISEGNLEEAYRALQIVDATPVFDSEKPSVFDKEYGHLLTMLELCGLDSKVNKICSSVIEADDAGKFFRIGWSRQLESRVPVYKAYLRTLARSKRGEIEQVIKKLQSKEIQNQFFGGNMQLWLGDFYESTGQYDKATICYEKDLATRERPYGQTFSKSDSPDRIISEARNHCYLLFRLAQFANKQNNQQKAIEYLQRAKQVYSSFFTDEQLVHIESVPLFSPSPSTVEIALACALLNTSDLDAAVKSAKSAVLRLQAAGAGNASAKANLLSDKDFVDGIKTGKWTTQLSDVGPIPTPGEPSEEERSFMSIFMRADTAITGGDSVLVRKLVETLFEHYQKREIVSQYPRPTLNMYCCLLHLGRHLADCGQFDESNNVFDRLKTAGCQLDHNSTTAIFLEIEKALNADLAKHPDPALWNVVFSSWKRSETDYQSLRALACLYLAAGELSRSEVLLNRALIACKKSTKSNTKAQSTTALLYLDKACLAVNKKRFDQVHSYFNKALSTADSVAIFAASNDLDLFNRVFMCSSVQLARFIRMQDRSFEAEKILKEVVARVDGKKYWLGVFQASDHPSIDPSQSYLYGYYGRLLCDHDRYNEARSYLDKAIAGYQNNVPVFLSTVHAECAAHQGDYAVAAKDLSNLVKRSSLFEKSVMSVQPKWQEIYSRKAIEYALKEKDFSAEELAKLYRQFAGLLNDNASEKLAALQNAYNLMAENSREKGEVAQQIINLSIINSGSDKALGRSLDRDARLKMQESAAISSEKNKAYDAPRLWMNLADSEVQNKQYDSAIEHIKRAINSQQATSVNGPVVEAAPIPGYAIRNLAEAGRQNDAELLYQIKLDRSKSLFGAQSIQYGHGLAELCIFYASQNNEIEAFEYLDQLFALDPRKQELGKTSESARHFVLDSAYGLLYKDWHNKLALNILEKLLDAQRKTYGSDDAHVSKVLTTIAIVETNNGAFIQAERHLREALAIDSLYANDPFGGRSDACSAMHSLLTKVNKTAELEALQKTWKLDQKEREKHALIAGNASEEQAQEFYDWWHNKAPYDYRCLSASIKLLDYAIKENKPERVCVLAEECINILSHNSLLAVGGCTPSSQPAQQKFHCFRAEIEACIELTKIAEARKWLERALSEESYKPMTEELIFLSEIENACGNREAALTYCKRAEETLPKAGGWNYWRETINQLYKKLGSDKDIQRIAADSQALMLMKQEEDLHKFEDERKAKATQKMQLKQPPRAALKHAAVEADESNESIQPGESLMFPAVEEIKDKYLFNYAAYASEELWLKDDATVLRDQNGSKFPYSFAGSYTGMLCFQPLHRAGQLMFLYDGQPGSLMLKSELPLVPRTHINRARHRNTLTPFTEPPPVMARPFKAAPETPPNATVLTENNNELNLKAGDYTAAHLSTNNIVLTTQGRVRIFLKDTEPSTQSLFVEKPKSIWDLEVEDKLMRPVFEATKNSCINLAPGDKNSSLRSKLELWYNGTGEISLGENSNFAGIIYAPNALIRLGKNARFCGAMVAREVIADERAKLMYQTSLRDWNYAQTSN